MLDEVSCLAINANSTTEISIPIPCRIKANSKAIINQLVHNNMKEVAEYPLNSATKAVATPEKIATVAVVSVNDSTRLRIAGDVCAFLAALLALITVIAVDTTNAPPNTINGNILILRNS